MPPSKNRLNVAAKRYATRADGTRYTYQGQRNSDDYEAYRKEVWALVVAATTPEERDALAGQRLAVHVVLRFPEGSKREEAGDPANCVDALLDALAPALGVNDRVFRSGQWTADDEWRGEGGCVVMLWALESPVRVESPTEWARVRVRERRQGANE